MGLSPALDNVLLMVGVLRSLLIALIWISTDWMENVLPTYVFRTLQSSSLVAFFFLQLNSFCPFVCIGKAVWRLAIAERSGVLVLNLEVQRQYMVHLVTSFGRRLFYYSCMKTIVHDFAFY